MSTAAVTLKEKVGYGFGDMASSMFWRVFSYYLPFFYTNIFGLRLDQVALLLIITRIWDAVSDPIMGIIADRTTSRWGKYRPYILFMSVPFCICGIFLFLTPNCGPSLKLVWAYVTYILMMTVYTGINVPYGAMLGVLTDDSDTKTVLSSFRMFFAYAGSLIIVVIWEPLCNAFGGYYTTIGWNSAMIVVATLCLLLFLGCFALTQEKVQAKSTVSILSDLVKLLKNVPWWILTGAVLCHNLFVTLRGSVVAYYFKDIIGADIHLSIGGLSFLFYAGAFLGIGEIANMAGVAIAPLFARIIGKKSTFISSYVVILALSVIFFFLDLSVSGMWMMVAVQILISLFTGIVSPLIWSMYADVSDYAENLNGTTSTGLIFSSSTMAQKFGMAIGGAALMWILSAFGYNTENTAAQSAEALDGLRYLMSFIPAGVACLAIAFASFYPLTKGRMAVIHEELTAKRAE